MKTKRTITESDLQNYEALALLFFNTDFYNIEKLSFENVKKGDCENVKLTQKIKNEVI